MNTSKPDELNFGEKKNKDQTYPDKTIHDFNQFKYYNC